MENTHNEADFEALLDEDELRAWKRGLYLFYEGFIPVHGALILLHENLFWAFESARQKRIRFRQTH